MEQKQHTRVHMHEVSPEVLQSDGPIVRVTREDMAVVREKARRSSRNRARICAHQGPDETVHEMLIVLKRENDLRPHRHPGKVESFHVMEGKLSVVQFDDAGGIFDVVAMGDYHSDRPFYYRQWQPFHHTILVESDFVAFQEVTQGPFSREGTVYPSWAPAEGAPLRAYLNELRRRFGIDPIAG